MRNASSRVVRRSSRRFVGNLLFVALAVLGLGLSSTSARAQSDVGGGDAGGCTLKDHVYTCDGATFQKALAGATTVAIETHNADGVARSKLKDLITKKLGKTIAPPGGPADLDFLLIPTSPEGVVIGATDFDLGTLRVYTSGPDGARGHLLWAEDLSGRENLPWPAVVHRLILQFESRFHIKEATGS
jgi:hypothetical protein